MVWKPGVGNIANYTKGKLDAFITRRTGVELGVSTYDTLEVQGFVSAMGIANVSVIEYVAVMPANHNGLLYGPITIRGEGSLRIGTDSNLVIRNILAFTGSL